MRLRRLWFISPALLAVLPSCAGTAAQDVIALDPGVRYQTMRGWEATAEIGSPCRADFAVLRDAVVRAAVNDLGIDRLRVEIRSGAENPGGHWRRWVAAGCVQRPDPRYAAWRAQRYATVNDNADPREIDWRGFDFAELDWSIENIVLPTRRELEAIGKRLHVNLTYVAFTRQISGGSYEHLDPDEYAEFVLATYLHLREKYRLTPDTWEVLLEPDNVPGFDGRLLGRAMVAAAKRLREHGFEPRFVAPSTTRMDNAVTWFDQMLAVPGAVEHLEELSYHRYGGVSRRSLEAIASRAARHGLATSMLEWWFGNATHEVLHEDLEVGRNASWQGRVLGDLFEPVEGAAATATLELQPEVRFTRQYFRFVKQGAVRIAARSRDGGVEPLAFINPDGSYVVVVRTDRPAGFTITGLPPGRYEVMYTTERAYAAELPAVNVSGDGVLSASIPGRGVITVHAAPATSPPGVGVGT